MNMTIAIICAVYTAIVVVLVRFMGVLHDCEEEMRELEMRRHFERAHIVTVNDLTYQEKPKTAA